MKALHLTDLIQKQIEALVLIHMTKKFPPSWVRNDAKNIFTSGFWVTCLNRLLNL